MDADAEWDQLVRLANRPHRYVVDASSVIRLDQLGLLELVGRPPFEPRLTAEIRSELGVAPDWPVLLPLDDNFVVPLPKFPPFARASADQRLLAQAVATRSVVFSDDRRLLREAERLGQTRINCALFLILLRLSGALGRQAFDEHLTTLQGVAPFGDDTRSLVAVLRVRLAKEVG